MLVLSRKKDEKIMIGDHIAITIVEVRGDRVKLGFEAPPSLAVHRQEVWLAIKKMKEADDKRT
jgi:carbon storage regulator